MAKKMTSTERYMDILKFVHRCQQFGGDGVTVGEYARVVGLSTSPYLRALFDELEGNEIVSVKKVEYKATYKRTFKINYEKVGEKFPLIKQDLMKYGWPERLI